MKSSLIMKPFFNFKENEDRFSDHVDFYDNNLVISFITSFEIDNDDHIFKDEDMKLSVAIYLEVRFLALQIFKSDILNSFINQT